MSSISDIIKAIKIEHPHKKYDIILDDFMMIFNSLMKSKNDIYSKYTYNQYIIKTRDIQSEKYKNETI